jgi:hypothetical protein
LRCGRPIELAQRVLTQGKQRIDDFMTAEFDCRLDRLSQAQRDVHQFGIDPNQLRQGQARIAVRDAKGEARNAFGRDGEAPALQREATVIGVQPEPFGCAVAVGNAHQSLAARIEFQPCLLERPAGRDGNLGMPEGDHAIARRPRRPRRDRLTVEGPLVQRHRPPDGPEFEFGQTLVQALDALLGGQGHVAPHGAFRRTLARRTCRNNALFILLLMVAPLASHACGAESRTKIPKLAGTEGIRARRCFVQFWRSFLVMPWVRPIGKVSLN